VRAEALACAGEIDGALEALSCPPFQVAGA
jgi:hypothetical protein